MGNTTTTQIVDVVNNVFQQSIKETVTQNESSIANVVKTDQSIYMTTCPCTSCDALVNDLCSGVSEEKVAACAATACSARYGVCPEGTDFSKVCGKINCKGGLKVENNASSESKIIANITSNTSNDLQAALDNSIDNKMDQAIKAVMGFMAVNSIDANNITKIKNRVTQISKSFASTSNLTSILNSTIALQKQKLVYGDIYSDGECSFTNNSVATMYTNALVNNLTNNIIKDELINRIVNSVKQKSDTTVRGLDDALKAGALMALAMGFMFIALAGLRGKSAGQSQVANTIIKIVIILVVAALIYFIAAWYFRWPPFQLKDHWGCEYKDGYATGNCVKYDNPKDGPYSLEADCKKDAKDGVSCLSGYDYKPASYACGSLTDPDLKSTCRRVNGVSLFKTSSECENSYVWSCKLTDDGFTLDPALPAAQRIQRYNKGDVPGAYQNDVRAQDTSSDGRDLIKRIEDSKLGGQPQNDPCRQYWYYGSNTDTNSSDKLLCLQTTKGSLQSKGTTYPTYNSCATENPGT